MYSMLFVEKITTFARHYIIKTRRYVYRRAETKYLGKRKSG